MYLYLFLFLKLLTIYYILSKYPTAGLKQPHAASSLLEEANSEDIFASDSNTNNNTNNSNNNNGSQKSKVVMLSFYPKIESDEDTLCEISKYLSFFFSFCFYAYDFPYKVYQFPDIPLYEIVFLVDRSGSMAGSRM